MFTVLMYGGIGDTLRNLSIFPHQSIYEKTGIRTTALYMHWRLTGEHQYPNPPGTEFFHGMADRFPSLRWGGETTSHRGPGAIANRLVREMIKLSHGGTSRFFPLEPVLTPDEMAALPNLSGQMVIGIQTHLLGTKTKTWGLNNWRRFLERMIARYPQAKFVLIETSEEVNELVLNENVLTTRNLNLYQILHLFRYFTLTISVDSWAKYAAAWNETPQVIVVPDQRPEYAVLTPESLLRLQFSGIYGKAQNKILGLEKTPEGRAAYTLDRMANLSPERLFEESVAHLENIPA